MKQFTIFGYTVIKTADLNAVLSERQRAVLNSDNATKSAQIASAEKKTSETELGKMKTVLKIKNEQIQSLSKKAYNSASGRFVNA